MRKVIYTLCILSVVILSGYLYIDNQPVKVIDIKPDQYAPVVIVDRLPFSATAKIKWWNSESGEILKKYNLSVNNSLANKNFYIYEFGEGYQEPGEKDRLCFPDIESPSNCLDKNILMIVRYRSNGLIQFDIGDDAYVSDDKGKIKPVD